jgi:hypothetical protein
MSLRPAGAARAISGQLDAEDRASLGDYDVPYGEIEWQSTLARADGAPAHSLPSMVRRDRPEIPLGMGSLPVLPLPACAFASSAPSHALIIREVENQSTMPC